MMTTVQTLLATAYGSILVENPTDEDLHLAIAHAMLAVAEIRRVPGGEEAYQRWKAQVRLETQRRAVS